MWSCSQETRSPPSLPSTVPPWRWSCLQETTGCLHRPAWEGTFMFPPLSCVHASFAFPPSTATVPSCVALPGVQFFVPFICVPISSGFMGSAFKKYSCCLLSQNFCSHHAYLTDLLLSAFRKSYVGCTLAPLLERVNRSRWQTLCAEHDQFRFTAAVAWRLQQRTRCC